MIGAAYYATEQGYLDSFLGKGDGAPSEVRLGTHLAYMGKLQPPFPGLRAGHCLAKYICSSLD